LRLAGRVEVLRRLIPMPLPTWTAARYPRSIRPIGGGAGRRAGDQVKAPEHLTTAATLYREMGMTFWLEKAEAALGGVER
jgi:hypothetical protein